MPSITRLFNQYFPYPLLLAGFFTVAVFWTPRRRRFCSRRRWRAVEECIAATSPSRLPLLSSMRVQ